MSEKPKVKIYFDRGHLYLTISNAYSELKDKRVVLYLSSSDDDEKYISLCDYPALTEWEGVLSNLPCAEIDEQTFSSILISALRKAFNNGKKT